MLPLSVGRKTLYNHHPPAPLSHFWPLNASLFICKVNLLQSLLQQQRKGELYWQDDGAASQMLQTAGVNGTPRFFPSTGRRRLLVNWLRAHTCPGWQQCDLHRWANLWFLNTFCPQVAQCFLQIVSCQQMSSPLTPYFSPQSTANSTATLQAKLKCISRGRKCIVYSFISSTFFWLDWHWFM